jgi:hypothetical protein
MVQFGTEDQITFPFELFALFRDHNLLLKRARGKTFSDSDGLRAIWFPAVDTLRNLFTSYAVCPYFHLGL